MMRGSVCAFVLLVPLCTGTGAAAPEHHVERLVALGKLWASVKYFHPALQESRPGWWDQALLGAVPSIDAASSRDQYAAALNAMLARLHDPVTRVENEAPEPNALAFGFAQAELRQGVLLVTSGRLASDPLESMQPLLKLLPRAQAIVFDLRPGPVHPWLWGSHLLPVTPESIPFPAHRFRVHVGNVTPRGAADVAFFSGNLTRSAPSAPVGQRGVHKRVVFLVSDSTQVPLVAPALQVAGPGYIIAEQPINDRAIARHGMAQHYRLPLRDGLVAHVRTMSAPH